MAEKPRTGLLPFDSARRMMTSIHATNSGSSKAYTKGSCYDVLARCTSIFNDGKVEPLTDTTIAEITRQITTFASEGYRVLAMASRELPSGTDVGPEVEKEMTLLGLAALRDPPRPKTEAAVRQAKSAGVKVIMITGDHELTAEAIARRVGILPDSGHVAVTGAELNEMSDEELSRILDSGDIVFARTTPEHKLRVVSALMAKGETVAVTGDGVNDSPALIEANVGIAMGAGGTDVARESADMVLLDNDFTSIVEGLRLGRATYDNLRKFVYYVYTHNFAELVTFVAFIILGIPLPLLVVQVLAIDLILEIPVSLALITEPPESDVLKRPPRARSVKLMDLGYVGRAAIIGVVVGAVSVLYAFDVWTRGGWQYGSADHRRPAGLRYGDYRCDGRHNGGAARQPRSRHASGSTPPSNRTHLQTGGYQSEFLSNSRCSRRSSTCHSYSLSSALQRWTRGLAHTIPSRPYSPTHR